MSELEGVFRSVRCQNWIVSEWDSVRIKCLPFLEEVGMCNNSGPYFPTAIGQLHLTVIASSYLYFYEPDSIKKYVGGTSVMTGQPSLRKRPMVTNICQEKMKGERAYENCRIKYKIFWIHIFLNG